MSVPAVRASSKLEPSEFFLLLEALLGERGAAIQRCGTIAFAVRGAGGWVIDLGGPQRVRRGFSRESNTIVICNPPALAALVEGRRSTEAGELGVFLWAGEPGPLDHLVEVLCGARSWLETRAAGITAARKEH